MTTRLNANSVEISTRTEAQRDALTAVAGMMIFNSTANRIEIYDGTVWRKAEGGNAEAGDPISITFSNGDGSSSGTTTLAVEENNAFTLDSASTPAGKYAVVTNNSGGAVTFDIYAWGGGGKEGGGPGPGGGAAGHGMHVRHTLAAAATMTLFAAGQSSSQNGRPFPDGGLSSPYGGASPGGGSSRVMPGTVPLPGRNDTGRASIMVAGGGGGGCNWLNSGPIQGYGGYPSGFRGNFYYPAEPSNADGKGGTQNAGGAGGASGRQPAGQAGAKYYGGTSSNTGGAGGGGGWFGGGGSGGYYAHGGGGASYSNPTSTFVTQFTATAGNSGHNTVPGSPAVSKGTAGNMNFGGYIQIKINSF